MKIEVFEMERLQSLWENKVDYNLSESGIHPFTLRELLGDKEAEKLLDLRLFYGETNGAQELREAVSRLYDDAGPDNILITNGSAEANYLTVWSRLEPGDEVIFMMPNYMQLWGLSRAFGATVKPLNLREDQNWAPDLEQLKKTLTEKTKLISVCNPNNPTGAVMSEKTMREIVDLARSCGAWIHADEVYRGAELDGNECPSFWGMYDKVLVAGGLSKAYALPGLRVGWLLGPKESIDTIWAYHDYTSISASYFSCRVATLALQPDQRHKVLQRNRNFLNENLAVLKKWVDRHDGMFSFIPPRAGGIAYLRYNLEIDSAELDRRLRDEKSVFVVAGACFHMDNYIRIGYGCEREYLEKGLSLIDEVLKKLS